MTNHHSAPRPKTAGNISGGAIIRVLVTTNPKRHGSYAAEIFNFYRDGMTVNDFVVAIGERRTALQHIRWDVAHDLIALEYEDSATALPPVQPRHRIRTTKGGSSVRL